MSLPWNPTHPNQHFEHFLYGVAKDEIAIDMGCNAAYAVSVCQMLDGEVSTGAGSNEAANPAPPPPKNGKNRRGENAPNNSNGQDNVPNPDPPAKKARPAKPQVTWFIYTKRAL